MLCNINYFITFKMYSIHGLLCRAQSFSRQCDYTKNKKIKWVLMILMNTFMNCQLYAVGFAIISKNNKASYCIENYRLFNMLDQVVGYLYYQKNSYSLDYYLFKQPSCPICLNLRIRLCGCMIVLCGCVLLYWVQLGWSQYSSYQLVRGVVQICA